MKVKRLPEDFIVDEQTNVQPGTEGDYVLYRLQKKGLATLEAIEAIQRRWELPRRKLSWGGLKDKYAVTTQYLTIHRGPPYSLQQGSYSLEYLGRVPRAYCATDIAANRFNIRLRSLTPEACDRAERILPAIARCGMPNYFDDQRFGSLGRSGEFIAEAWIRGDYERTLWLTFADPNGYDQAAERKEKALLRSLWGDWTECKRQLARSHRRSIITFLADRPGDFKGAWTRVNQDLRSLYLAAFQSQLWNELLANLIRSRLPAEELIDVEFKTGPLPFPAGAGAGLSELAVRVIPLPSARIRLEEIEEEWLRTLIEETLARRQLELRMLRVKSPRDSFFSKGSRAAFVPVAGLQFDSGADDLHPGRRALQLQFELPRGSYATILIKSATDAACHSEPPADDESN